MSKEDKVKAMVALSERCQEIKKGTRAKLAEKYLQPLTHLKKISHDEWDAHLAKIDRLFHGQGVEER